MLVSRLAEQLRQCVLSQSYDVDDVIGLPYPYSVPTPGKTFHCLFYWDTYFTNLGLLESGKECFKNATKLACGRTQPYGRANRIKIKLSHLRQLCFCVFG